MSAEKFNSKLNLRKFKKHFIIGGISTLLIILILVYTSEPKEEKAPDKPTASATFSAAKNLNPSPGDIMAQRLDSFTSQQNQQNQQYAQRIAELESQNQAYQKQITETESGVTAINEKLVQLNTTKANASSSLAVTAAPKPQRVVFEDDINSDGSDSDSEFQANAQKAAKNQTMNTSPNSADSKDKNPDKSISTYIPSNTIVPGVLVSSASANTGGNASSDPTPMLVRLTNFARLPNEFKSNLRSCMVSASGWGDLSTERIKARTATLSCVLKSGKAIDIPVEGYIAGEDSKAGVAGVVVTRSGGVAAKATLAGFIQGIGQIGQAIGQTQTITPLGGVTTTVDAQQALISGAGSGVSQAGQTLSQYYMNMLTQISPAIEVAAGRHVTVIFTKGVELKLPINEQNSANETRLPIAG